MYLKDKELNAVLEKYFESINEYTDYYTGENIIKNGIKYSLIKKDNKKYIINLSKNMLNGIENIKNILSKKVKNIEANNEYKSIIKKLKPRISTEGIKNLNLDNLSNNIDTIVFVSEYPEVWVVNIGIYTPIILYLKDTNYDDENIIKINNIFENFYNEIKNTNKINKLSNFIRCEYDEDMYGIIVTLKICNVGQEDLIEIKSV